MKISYIHIWNFKFIRDMEINDVENAFILVGKNNTGKTAVLDAIRLVAGDYDADKSCYLDASKSIRVEMKVKFDEEDLYLFHSKGMVSKYKRYELWKKDFYSKLPSYRDGLLSFQCIVNPYGTVKYNDGFRKNNPYIRTVFPKVYYIGQQRNLEPLQNEVFRFYDKSSINDMKENKCIFDVVKRCNRCFNCIGLINQKSPQELSAIETAKLLEYKLFHTNIHTFTQRLNRHFRINGGMLNEIRFEMGFDPEKLFEIEAKVYNPERGSTGAIETLGEGMQSIYLLSLLEAYIEEKDTIPCIILIEDPEMYLHPQLQKTAGQILYRLSKKNQVIFTTHSPNLIFNFSSRQIKQVVMDQEYFTVVKTDTDIDEILDDLGYTANDLMNVSFVFIVEGKQDKSRLPLLLEKYYSEVQDEDGNLQRIAIVPTNSCTNIKTYANLKYINQLYLKDSFLMIRDGDGKNAEELRGQLCSYYQNRVREDVGGLPRVLPRNVLVLRYYSFENYFLNPRIMKEIGVIESEEAFYDILYKKYAEYLYKLTSTKNMLKNIKIRIDSKQDLKDNMELVKIYVRGHNLYDIFYGKYRGEAENNILSQYIDAAPKEEFRDILDAIDAFVYFENRRK